MALSLRKVDTDPMYTQNHNGAVLSRDHVQCVGEENANGGILEL